MSDISELREWASNKIKLYDKMAVEAPHLYASDVSRSMLHQVVELCDKTAWHYPSKGEYPPKGKQILAYAWNVHNVLAKYDTFDGKDRFVTFDAYNGFIEIEKVICWQYIVPPKENEK